MMRLTLLLTSLLISVLVVADGKQPHPGNSRGYAVDVLTDTFGYGADDIDVDIDAVYLAREVEDHQLSFCTLIRHREPAFCDERLRDERILMVDTLKTRAVARSLQPHLFAIIIGSESVSASGNAMSANGRQRTVSASLFPRSGVTP